MDIKFIKFTNEKKYIIRKFDPNSYIFNYIMAYIYTNSKYTILLDSFFKIIIDGA